MRTYMAYRTRHAMLAPWEPPRLWEPDHYCDRLMHLPTGRYQNRLRVHVKQI